jgi:hypothetical protein
MYNSVWSDVRGVSSAGGATILGDDTTTSSGAPTTANPQTPLFKWETLREVRSDVLRYKDPIYGKTLEVELTSGAVIEVFRADDGQFYFCHGLTFGGKDAPGGAVSPFSGKAVRTIVTNHYRLVDPESQAVEGDILVWTGLDDETPHSAILTVPIIEPGKNFLAYTSKLRSKNGMRPEAELTLEALIIPPEGYGEFYNVFRRN